MCNGIICSTCVYDCLKLDLCENDVTKLRQLYQEWRLSCPNEDALVLGTMIPLYLNLLQFELQYYFLYIISLNFDPLTLSEWGIE